MTHEIADLYAGPWETFVARRTELAAEIRASGDRVTAKTVAGLRKPSRAAWLVNLLVRAENSQVTEVLDLGEALARAHRDADPDELRRLARMRTAVISWLANRAVELGAEHGYAASDAVREEVAETLQSAMADPAIADQVLEGALVVTVRAAGFGPVDLFAPDLADVLPIRPASEPSSSSPVPDPVEPDPAEVRRLERERGRAEGRLEEAQERLARAQAAEAELRAELAAAQTQSAELRARVDEIGRLLAAAHDEHDRAERHVADLNQALAVRAAALEAMRTEIARLSALVEEVTGRLAELGITD